MIKIKKIALIIINLNIGGAEKSTVLLGEMLQEMGYEVSLITVNESIELKTDLSLISLQSSRNFLLNKLSKFIQLKSYLKRNKIDLIIDNRSRNSIFKEFFYFLVYYKYKKIYLVRSYLIDNYVCKNSYLSRKLFKKINHFAVVSEEIKEELRHRVPSDKITTIYDFVPKQDLSIKSHNLVEKSYILFFGRFHNSSKDFVFLLKAYKASKVWVKGVTLVMLGKGPDEQLLLNTIQDLGLQQYVNVVDATPNPESYIKSAFFTVMTSNYEGFPRGIIESLSLGIPVVSTDFKSGPREIIKNNINGLIVSKDIHQFSWALNEMIDNDELYNNCISKAVYSVSHFSKENFSLQWKELINNI